MVRPAALLVAAFGLAGTALGDSTVFEQLKSPEQLFELLAELDLPDADLDDRAAICSADHLAGSETNRRLLVAGWPGPFFEGAGVGTAELIEAPAARRRGAASSEAGTGQVTLRFVVDSEGRVQGAAGLLERTESPALLEAALRAVSSWRFKPALVNGRPGAVCRKQVVSFPAEAPDPDAVPAVTREMIEWVTTPEELLEMIDQTGALVADPETRSAICWLAAEARTRDLDRRLFRKGWPGPFLGGSDLKGAQPAAPIKAPGYTEEARHNRIEGLVAVRFVVDAAGRPGSFRVEEPLPYGLTEAAIAVLSAASFQPARLFGRPVSSCYSRVARFALQ